MARWTSKRSSLKRENRRENSRGQTTVFLQAGDGRLRRVHAFGKLGLGQAGAGAGGDEFAGKLKLRRLRVVLGAGLGVHQNAGLQVGKLSHRSGCHHLGRSLRTNNGGQTTVFC